MAGSNARPATGRTWVPTAALPESQPHTAPKVRFGPVRAHYSVARGSYVHTAHGLARSWPARAGMVRMQVAGEHACQDGGAQQPGGWVEQPSDAQESLGEDGVVFGGLLEPADVGVDDADRQRAWRGDCGDGQVGAGGQLPGG